MSSNNLDALDTIQRRILSAVTSNYQDVAGIAARAGVRERDARRNLPLLHELRLITRDAATNRYALIGVPTPAASPAADAVTTLADQADAAYSTLTVLAHTWETAESVLGAAGGVTDPWQALANGYPLSADLAEVIAGFGTWAASLRALADQVRGTE